MFRLEVADRIATLVLDRPPANAINAEWTAALHALLDGLEKRADWRVLHIRSAHAIFCAGADLKTMRERFGASNGADLVAQDARDYQKLFARIEALPHVSLAEIGGAAMGGGLELALSCDLRIAAEEAKIGLPEVRLGLLPGAGGTQRMTRLCGSAMARRLILGAEILGGAEACRLGVVQWAVPRTALATTARAHAERIAALPRNALAWAKTCIAAASLSNEAGFAEEIRATRALTSSEETRALVAAFLSSRAS
jgi:enoyl-CoA hydratase/carnithine racemase